MRRMLDWCAMMCAKDAEVHVNLSRPTGDGWKNDLRRQVSWLTGLSV